MSEAVPSNPRNAGQKQPGSAGTVDPQLLSELLEKAEKLKHSGDGAFVNTLLMQLDESVRDDYRQPLLDKLSEPVTSADAGAASDRSQDADGQATIEPEAYQAPTAAPDLPEPSSKSGGSVRAPIPENIGKFKIKRELGRGACGAVYLGYDEELERYVAVKVSHVTDRQQQELLRIEASKLAQIESVGIVPVYHIGKTEFGELFIVEKYIQGSTLRDLARPGPLSPAMAVTLMREIALGLEAAHHQDILHRDLKPDNIMVEENGRPWIADFGLAINEEEQQIQSRQLAGTPPYMSPEQIIGKVDFLDARSDIWALGVMYYELLTGKLPFTGKDRQTLTDQICERDPRPLQQRAPGRLSKEMNEIFLRCCAKQPSDRYATARELADDLENLIVNGSLDNQNIHGDTMVSSISESVNETFGSIRQSRRTTVEPAPQQLELPAHAHAHAHASMGTRAMAVATVMAITVLGIVIAGVMFSGDDVAQQGAAEPGSSQDPPINPINPVASVDPPPAVMEDAMEFDSDYGSRLKPWIVAKDDSGTHTTISDAIAASKIGDVIKVMSGEYEESLTITKTVTIEGVNVGEKPPRIRNDQQSPITINSPGGNTVIQDLDVIAEGVDEKFNAINVNDGQLRLLRCKLRSDEYNCIKVSNGSALKIEDCEFLGSGQHAIVAVEGSKLDLRDSKFLVPGVQIVGADALIKDCNFFGIEGVHVSNSPEPIRIEDCDFNGKRNALSGYGIRSSNGGKVVAKRITVEHYDSGLSAGRNVSDKGMAGQIELQEKVEIKNCINGISIVSGASVSAEACESDERRVIDDCQFGARVDEGNLELWDFLISNIKMCGALAENRANVQLYRCKIEDCRHGIEIQNGELQMRGGHVNNCSVAAMFFGHVDHIDDTKVHATIDNVTLGGFPNFGIHALSGAITLKNVTITGGRAGINADGPPLSRPSLTPVVEITAVENVTLEKTGIHASGDARITLAEEVLDTLIRKGGVAPEKVGPARIVSPSNSVDPDDSENPFRRLN